MNKSYSYFSRLNPNKQRALRQPVRRQEDAVKHVKVRHAQVQLEPIFAFSAVGPSSEF